MIAHVWSERPLWIAAAALTFVVFLAGGASRIDVPGHMIVQLVAVVAGAVIVVMAPPPRIEAVRRPALFALACLAVPLLQLLPLPPGIWEKLPGHRLYADAVLATGAPIGWRPASLTPDLTIAGLLSLLVPIAAFVTIVGLGRRGQPLVLTALIVGALASAVLGLAQLSASSPTALRFYSVTNIGSEVGVFANRNHQAALLALALPMIATWLKLYPGLGLQRFARQLIAGFVALFLSAMAIATGSRAGLVLILLGAMSGALLLWTGRGSPRRMRAPDTRHWLAIGAAALVGVGLLAAVLFARRDAVVRLVSTDVSSEERLVWLGPLFRMAADFFPFGSGLGSFDSVYRSYEPFHLLQTTYLNHAHNDLLELVSDTGLAGLGLLIVFVAWWSVQTIRVWRAKESEPRIWLGRLGSQMILMLLIASLPDYPLRTPLLAFVFAVGAAWLWSASAPRKAGYGKALPA